MKRFFVIAASRCAPSRAQVNMPGRPPQLFAIAQPHGNTFIWHSTQTVAAPKVVTWCTTLGWNRWVAMGTFRLTKMTSIFSRCDMSKDCDICGGRTYIESNILRRPVVHDCAAFSQLGSDLRAYWMLDEEHTLYARDNLTCTHNATGRKRNVNSMEARRTATPSGLLANAWQLPVQTKLSNER